MARMNADRLWKWLSAFLLVLLATGRASGQKLLIPMDDDQQNHLKAYGLTYNAIKANQKAE